MKMNVWPGGKRERASEWVPLAVRGKQGKLKARRYKYKRKARARSRDRADMGYSDAGPLRGEMQDADPFGYAPLAVRGKQGKLKARRYKPRNRGLPASGRVEERPVERLGA